MFTKLKKRWHLGMTRPMSLLVGKARGSVLGETGNASVSDTRCFQGESGGNCSILHIVKSTRRAGGGHSSVFK